MRDLNSCRAYVAYLHSEHHRLDEQVRQIQESLTGTPSAAPPGTTPQITTPQMLQALRDELNRHFSEEEQGGCIEEAVCRQPGLSAQARPIQRQHGELLRQLDQVMERVAEHSPDTARAEFDVFAKELRQHEALETKIVEEGFNLNLNLES